MNRRGVISIAVVIAFLFVSCKEKSADPGDQGPVTSSFQSSKCGGGGLLKTMAKDSLFTYTFTDRLVIDFSLSGNCCPDSNRYSVSSVAGTDTIVIAVVDTAEHLCRCMCQYIIRSEFLNLPNDHYVVKCTLTDPPLGEPIQMHRADVYRQ